MCSILRLVVLVAVVGFAELITVKTRTPMNVELGQDAMLECTFETTEDSTNGLSAIFEFESSGSTSPIQIYYYQSGTVFIPEQYKERLVPPSSPGQSKNVSVLLRNMQVADTGLYTCTVRNVPDVSGIIEGRINLKVLQVPSKPYCSIHGTAHLGYSATLVCHSQHGSPTPTYTWSRVGQANTRTDVVNTGTLAIENITESDFGSYRCTSQNVAGTSICELDFYDGATDVGKLDSNDVGYIAAIVLGVVLGLVLIGLAIWLIVQSVNKKKYKGVRQTEGTQMSPTNPE